jgi:hypothetical protein
MTKWFLEIPCKHTQKYDSLISSAYLNPIKLTVKVNKATFSLQNFLDNKILRNKNVHIIFRLERTGSSVNGKFNAMYCMNSVNAYFHASHPSYSGGRDQEDPGSKTTSASSS